MSSPKLTGSSNSNVVRGANPEVLAEEHRLEGATELLENSKSLAIGAVVDE